MSSTKPSASEFADRMISVLKKSTTFNLQPTEESFPELPDVLMWVRFFLAAGYGYLLGVKGIRSGSIPIQALNLVVFVPVFYCRLYLGTQSGTFDRQIVFSGSFNAMALFMLVWLYLFTMQHEDDERKLASLLVLKDIVMPDDGAGGDDPTKTTTTTTTTGGEGATSDQQEPDIGMEEQEF